VSWTPYQVVDAHSGALIGSLVRVVDALPGGPRSQRSTNRKSCVSWTPYQVVVAHNKALIRSLVCVVDALPSGRRSQRSTNRKSCVCRGRPTRWCSSCIHGLTSATSNNATFCGSSSSAWPTRSRLHSQGVGVRAGFRVGFGGWIVDGKLFQKHGRVWWVGLQTKLSGFG